MVLNSYASVVLTINYFPRYIFNRLILIIMKVVYSWLKIYDFPTDR
jgi:hypothetical protein